MKKAELNVGSNEMIVFERPISIKGDIIYGFIKSSDFGNDSDIAEYVAYLVGAERFEKLKGSISDDWTLWRYPDEIHAISANSALQNFTSFLFQDTVGYQVFNFDEPIEWKDGEVDVYEGVPCFIFKEELIDRYTQKEIEE